MASIKTKFRVGLFVIIGLAVAAIAFIWLGMSHYFEKGQYYLAYFDESVQGLDKDSPVKYRGVSIGRVENIGVAPDAKLIQVVMKIEAGLKNREQLVAQLKSVGITGIMFIEMDQKAGDEPDLSPKVSFPSKYPVVATRPSGIKTFVESIGDLLKQLKGFDTEGISENFKAALDTINKAVEDAKIDGIATDIRSSLAQLEKILDPKKWENVLGSIETAGQSFNALVINADRTVTGINDAINKIDGDIEGIGDGLRGAIAEFKDAMGNVNQFIESGSSLIMHTDGRLSGLERHLLVSLRNLERASGNLNRLLEIVADRPSLLIFGDQPPPREIEKDP